MRRFLPRDVYAREHGVSKGFRCLCPWLTIEIKTERISYEWRFNQAKRNEITCKSPFRLSGIDDSFLVCYWEEGDGSNFHKAMILTPDPVFDFLVNSSEEELKKEIAILEECMHFGQDDDSESPGSREYKGPLKWWRPISPLIYYDPYPDPDADGRTVGLLSGGRR